MNNRLLRIVYSQENKCLIGSDVSGRVHKYGHNLDLLSSSPVTSYIKPINSICTSDSAIFTRDRFGTVGKWDLHTLQPVAFLDGNTLCDRTKLHRNEIVSPSPNRAMAIYNNKIYTTNGYAQLVLLDPLTLDIIDIRDSPSDTFIDCICADHPDVHVISDYNGNILIGNLESNQFDRVLNVDTNVVHSIVYDEKFDRFWTTQDGGLGKDRGKRTGVTRFNLDGTGFEEFKLSHEDNEFIAIDPSGEWVITGGFNGYLSIFSNKERHFTLQRSIGPFDFQIISGAVESDQRIFVLLQTGVIASVDIQGRKLAESDYDHTCAWIFQPHPADHNQMYVGTDQGVALIEFKETRFGGISVTQRWHHIHGLGICKDVRPLEDGSYVAVSRKGFAFLADKNGGISWKRQVLGVPRSVALSNDSKCCLVSTDEGSVWEFKVKNGDLIDTIPVGSPSYACTYLDDGRRVVSSDGDQQVIIYSPDSHDIQGRIHGFEYRIKRFIKSSEGIVYAVGPDGVFELEFNSYTISRKYGDYLVSTKENGVVSNDHIYIGGYGFQLGAYNLEDTEIIDLKEDMQDFTKALHVYTPPQGKPFLFAGGRGGFINIYRLINGIPLKIREFYLH